MDTSTKLNLLISSVERGIDRFVPPYAGSETGPARIHDAMRYSLQAGGKRLRPVLVLAAAELFGAGEVADDTNGNASGSPLLTSPKPGEGGSALNSQPSTFNSPPSALPAAIAIECVHTYSLIHDDLPCMDNDDLRRGRPTAHKAFDEATALLAGDALLTHAFAVIAENYFPHPGLTAALVRELAAAAGSTRLIGGQMQDLLAEKNSAATARELEFIHLNKTAAMLEVSLVAGALVAGQRPGATLDTLRAAGRHLGLAFQIVDDVLDATADSATLGKTAGKDAKADKTTYVKLHGIDQARRLAAEQTDRAIAALESLGRDATFLIALTRSMAARAK